MGSDSLLDAEGFLAVDSFDPVVVDVLLATAGGTGSVVVMTGAGGEGTIVIGAVSTAVGLIANEP